MSNTTVMQEAGRKSWETRRRNEALANNSNSTLTAGQKSWVTRRANQKNDSVTSSSSRSLDLAGTRKMRASVPTLVSRMKDAGKIDYYYGSERSVIVLNN